MRILPPFNRNVLVYMFSDSFYYGGVAVVDAFLTILLTAQIVGGKLDTIGLVLGYALILRAVAEIPCAYLVRNYSFLTKKYIVFFAFLVYGLTLIAMGFFSELCTSSSARLSPRL